MFVCSACAAEYHVLPPTPKCTRCCKWNTLIDSSKVSLGSGFGRMGGLSRMDTAYDEDDEEEEDDENEVEVADDDILSLDNVEGEDSEHRTTHIRQLDKVLNGGPVEGALIVLGGDPGAGKSTFVFQLIEWLDAVGYYVSGEMKLRRLRGVAKRLKVKTSRIYGMDTTDIDKACSVDPNRFLKGKNRNKPLVVVFDAIQVFTSQTVKGAPGSTTQLPYVMKAILSWVQENDAIGIAISRFNSSGVISGGNDTQHDGDATLTLTCPSGPEDTLRRLTVKKNRDGAAGFVECNMGDKGLVF